MTMQLIRQIFDYISILLSICLMVFTTICFIVNKIKQKAKRIDAEEQVEKLETKLEDSEDIFKLVNEIIPLAMKKAEELPLIKAQTKKLMAMSEILLNCNANNISFEKYKDFIDEQIEALIEFSKTINKREE